MIKNLTVLLVGLLVANCTPRTNDSSQKKFVFQVKDAPEWSALFKRNTGWFGGDGIFAIPMKSNDYGDVNDSSKILFLFGDTMIGEIENDSLLPGFHMVNNSFAVITGKEPVESNISFLINSDSAGNNISVFVPTTPNSKPGEYFWFGDGFYNHAAGKIYIFGYRIINLPGVELFGFDETGNILITFDPDEPFPFQNHQQKDTPFWFGPDDPKGRGSFGAAIFDNTEEAGVSNPDGYVYVYGVRGNEKSLYVARVFPNQFEEFNSWEFWNGENWDIMDNMAPVADSVSNELSITSLEDGGYLLVSQVRGIQPAVGIRVGETPVGPFGELIEVWDCSEALDEPEFFAYNAKGHPAISQPGELIVSYNVNSFAFWEQIESYPNLYRPRFFKIILK